MKLKISIIYGSVRENRQGIKAAKFIQNKLKERGFNTTLIDPKEYDLPLLNKMYKEFEKPPEKMAKLAKTLDDSDGFVVVSGEYNHSIPPALKNLLDHFQKEYHHKPSALVTYSAGPFAGLRNLHNLRAIMGELGTVSIPIVFSISKVQNSFDDSGKALDESYDRRVKRFLDEFTWYVEALKSARDKGVPY